MSSSVEGAIERHFAARGEVVEARFSAAGGSSLHQTGWVGLQSPDGDSENRLFVKFGGQGGRAERRRRFAAEVAGLEALASFCPGPDGDLRVPQGVWLGDCAEGPFLAMEAVAEGAHEGRFFPRFGRALAEVHRRSLGDRYGFEGDNYLGLTEQPNRWSDDWVSFYRRCRLGHQLTLVRQTGRSTAELDRLGDRLLERLDSWLDLPGERASLLHGDLWSGNFLVGSAGEAVLIDPAVHYGHRECDLAMARLFGGFSDDFYRAYEEAWPLPADSSQRIEIYQLYHRLNHLVLFGTSYLPGCLATLRRFVG